MPLAVCIYIIIISILLIIHAIYQGVVVAPRKQEFVRHYELSQKLYDKAMNTSSLSTARECYTQLNASYALVRDYVDRNSRSCFEDDIQEVRSCAENLAQEKWSGRAEKYLSEIERLLSCVMASNSQDVTQAKKDCCIILKLYDSYWDWTRECHEDNRSLWSRINIWDVAKDMMSAVLGNGFTCWNDSGYGHPSVRAQLECRLSDHIVSLQSKEKKAPRRKAEKLMIEPKPKLLHDAVIRHFDEEKVEYVDKTSVGGSLYFFAEAVANDLTEKGFQVHFAENGTKGTGYRPAWYIRFQ